MPVGDCYCRTVEEVKMAMVENIRVPTEIKSNERGCGSEFVLAGTGAGTTLNLTDID
jgi:hypothetical protein